MRELKTGLFFLVFSLIIVWESLRVGLGTPSRPGSGFLTFCAGTLLALFSLVLIYKNRGLRHSGKPLSRRVLIALVILLTYSLVLDYLGFIVATFLLVGIFSRLASPRPWWVLLIISTSVTFLAYLIFDVLLRVYFPKGFLGM